MAKGKGEGGGSADFDRDFGYLTPFMDRVAQAAGALADSAARAELTRLMVEEKARWARVKELLAGAPGRAVAGTDLRPASSPVQHRSAGTGSGLTVGSLKTRP